MSSCGDRDITKTMENSNEKQSLGLMGGVHICTAFCNDRANRNHSFSMRVTISDDMSDVFNEGV